MRISEVSEKFDLTPDTLRYYERIGLIPDVKRNGSGNRDYTDQDCKWVEFVKCMRDAGLSIEVLVEYLDLFQQGDSSIEDRKKLLIEQRDLLDKRLEEMQKTVDRLNHKIEIYEEKVVRSEKQLKTD